MILSILLSIITVHQALIQYDLNMSNARLAMDYGEFIEAKSDRNMYTLTLRIS
jgi:[ribulose-bisphosphate carboxylase]-lysine N-methyltransferase